LVEKDVTSAELVAAFARLRALWKRLFEELPPAGAREEEIARVREDLDVVAAGSRVSGEAQPFVELVYLIRMDQWRIGGAQLPGALEDAAEGVRSGLEMRLRTLRQMESGDEVLSDAGREIRRSAGRDLVFFRDIRRLGRGESGDQDTSEAERLVQIFDPRRKLVREDVVVPTPALEAVEFLVRLGAS
jgi:hypothetical protein